MTLTELANVVVTTSTSEIMLSSGRLLELQLFRLYCIYPLLTIMRVISIKTSPLSGLIWIYVDTIQGNIDSYVSANKTLKIIKVVGRPSKLLTILIGYICPCYLSITIVYLHGSIQLSLAMSTLGYFNAFSKPAN